MFDGMLFILFKKPILFFFHNTITLIICIFFFIFIFRYLHSPLVYIHIFSSSCLLLLPAGALCVRSSRQLILQNLRKSRTERRGRLGSDALNKQKQLNNKNSLIMKVINRPQQQHKNNYNNYNAK